MKVSRPTNNLHNIPIQSCPPAPAAPEGPIFLIGYMACGKTTLGEALKEAFPGLVDFVDLDHEVERLAGMSVAGIFATAGESAFRAMERETLAQLATAHSPRRLIVACGGGTPCHSDSMDLMLSRGTAVWLRASRERTISRLLEADGERPLVAGMDAETLGAFIDSHLAERFPAYSRAHFCFDSSELENAEEIAATVARFAAIFNNFE